MRLSFRVLFALFALGGLFNEVCGKERDIPDSLKHLWHNNAYLRLSLGFSNYFEDARNGYAAFSEEEIRSGICIEPEIGTFIKDFMQVGVSYLYLDGTSEDTEGIVINDYWYGYGYDDVFFQGAAFKVRYFLLNRKKLKVPVGVEGIWGICRLKSGLADDLEKKRGVHNSSALGEYKAPGFGGGLSGSFSFYPFWFLSIGVDAGLRILVSRGLRDVDDDWELPDYTEGGVQRLNFSSINLKAYLSLQM